MRALLLLVLYAGSGTSFIIPNFNNLLTDNSDFVAMNPPIDVDQMPNPQFGSIDLPIKVAQALGPNLEATEPTNQENRLSLTNPNVEDNSLALDSGGRGITVSKPLSDYQIAGTADSPNLLQLGEQLRVIVASVFMYYLQQILASQTTDGPPAGDTSTSNESSEETEPEYICPLYLYLDHSEALCDMGFGRVSFSNERKMFILLGFTIYNIAEGCPAIPLASPSLVKYWCCDPSYISWRDTTETSIASDCKPYLLNFDMRMLDPWSLARSMEKN